MKREGARKGAASNVKGAKASSATGQVKVPGAGGNGPGRKLAGKDAPGGRDDGEFPEGTGELENGEVSDDHVTEEELSGRRTPRLFPLRLGFFTVVFLIFYAFAVLLLNITEIAVPDENFDLFETIITWIRETMFSTGILRDIYDFFVPIDYLKGYEAMFISTAILLSFLVLSIATTRENVRDALFRSRAWKRGALQLGSFLGLFLLFMQVLVLVSRIFQQTGLTDEPAGLNIYVLAAGAFIWIFFQSISLFAQARRMGTNYEQGLLQKRGGGANLVLAMPVLVLFMIFALTIAYTWFVNLLETTFGSSLDINYSLWKNFTTAFFFGFAFLTVISTTSALNSGNAKKKKYDNLVVMITMVFMFPYTLFNFALYFILPKSGGETSTGGGDPGDIMVWLDMTITLVLLVMAMRAVGARTNYTIGRFKEQSLILFIYAALSGQFGVRYLQTRNKLPAFSGLGIDLGQLLLDSQYILVNAMIMIGILAIILMFSSKKFGVMFRTYERVSRTDRKRMAFIHEHLKMEFNKENKPYLVDTQYDTLAAIMKLDRLEVMSLVEKANRRNDDMRIEGIKKRYVYFTSPEAA